MSNKYRLSSGEHINRSESISFKFNGKTFYGFKATPGSGHLFAHTIAKDQPHDLNAAFNIDRFVSGDLVDEHGAAAVAH